MRLGVCTGGGDCPGLNAAIKAIVSSSLLLGHEVFGILDSLTGLLSSPPKYLQLSLMHVDDILTRGGTILGTDNSGNPYSDPLKRAARVQMTLDNARLLGLDVLIVIGGEGTQAIAGLLSGAGLNVIGVPKTIDNDLPATDRTIGFDSAVNIVRESVERLQSTAESHDRIMILEVMGRDSGYIALHGGIAGGANVILIPEIPFDTAKIVDAIDKIKKRGIHYSVVVVAEGAAAIGDSPFYLKSPDQKEVLGGIGNQLAKTLHQATNMETRVTVLGHVQRGGSPTAGDRILASRFGVRAVEEALKKNFGTYLALQGTNIVPVSYKDLNMGARKKIPLTDDHISSAESTGINLGR